MDYKMPFKKHITNKKELFLKTLKQMLAHNETGKIKLPKKKTVKKPVKSTVKKYIKISGEKRLIHFGKKGGRYYIKNKIKHYVPKTRTLIGGNQMGGNQMGGNQTGGKGDFSGVLTASALFMLSKMLSQKNIMPKKSKKSSKS
jgi:hypothetical protein